MLEGSKGVPRVSVVIPLHNKEKYLIRTLSSVAMQDFIDFEVVIVDDGSTDGCASLASEFAAHDERFRLIRKKTLGFRVREIVGLVNPTARLYAF